MGFARLGNTAHARKEIDALQLLHNELIQSKQEYWAEQLQIQRRAATAWVALAEGNRTEALTLMRSAADLEDVATNTLPWRTAFGRCASSWESSFLS